MKIYQKIAKVSLETLGKINKSGAIQYKKATISYADLNKDILPILLPICNRNEIYFSFTTSYEPNLVTGEPIEYLVLTVVHGEEVVTSKQVLKPYATLQDRGSQITYLKRYMLVALFNLNTEPDLDGSMTAKVEELGKSDEEKIEDIKKDIEILLSKVKDKERVENYIFRDNKINKDDINIADLPKIRTAINAVYNKMRAKGAK